MLGLRRHCRCIAALITSHLFSRPVALRLVGIILRKLLRLRLESIFLLYPARQEYADALAYRWHQRQFAWRPGLIGIYRQGTGWGLIFGIPNPETQIREEANAENVRTTARRMSDARAAVGARRHVFAGVIPSVLARLGHEEESLTEQRYLTARAVLEGLDDVFARHQLGSDAPVLVLGGRGYIAAEVARLCCRQRLYPVDVESTDRFREFVARFHGTPAVVLNLSKSGALMEYADSFWPGLIVLNEVYPEPSAEELERIKARGAICYHIVGVSGRAWPPFPRAYRGGIPCCASLPLSPDEPIPVQITLL